MRLRLITVTALIVAYLTFAALAAAACDPNGSNIWGNYGRGWEVAGLGYVCNDASHSDIENYSPYVQYGTVTMWTAIYNNSSGGYAKVGWWKQANGNRYNFTESDTAGGGFQYDLFTASTVNSFEQYKVRFDSQSGYIDYFIDGDIIDTDYDTAYSGCWAQQAAQMDNLANQLPGGYNNGAYFTNSEVRDDGVWYDFGASSSEVGDQYPPYRTDSFELEEINDNILEIWDSACA